MIFLVPPVIDSMSFPQVLVLREGARARLQCVVSQGDLPLSISWLKNDRLLTSDMNMQIRKDDEFSSVLTFISVSTSHNGSYTCIAKNSGGSTNLTAQITIEGIQYTFSCLELKSSAEFSNEGVG